MTYALFTWQRIVLYVSHLYRNSVIDTQILVDYYKCVTKNIVNIKTGKIIFDQNCDHAPLNCFVN